MRIMLRTSGGRGEYELAGSQDGIRNSDLYGLQILYEVTPEIVLPSGTYADSINGKPRIRTLGNGVHSYRALSAILLMPKPIREVRKTGSRQVILKEGQYSVGAIDVDICRIESDKAVLRPVSLVLINNSENSECISVAGRMSRIARLWASAKNRDDRLAMLILQHEEAITSSTGNMKAIERAARALATETGTSEDCLLLLERAFGLCGPREDRDSEGPGIAPQEDDDTSILEATQRRVAEWRMQAVRGAAGRRFSLEVKEAYRSTCLFSGSRLPKTELIPVAGVEAAHILPWKHYDLDTISNGLCLNRLCHWGFDNGLLRLDYDCSSLGYKLSVPEFMREHAKKNGADIAYFLELEGNIPRERLPDRESDWPSPGYLNALNGMLCSGDTSSS